MPRATCEEIRGRKGADPSRLRVVQSTPVKKACAWISCAPLLRMQGAGCRVLSGARSGWQEGGSDGVGVGVGVARHARSVSGTVEADTPWPGPRGVVGSGMAWLITVPTDSHGP